MESIFSIWVKTTTTKNADLHVWTNTTFHTSTYLTKHAAVENLERFIETELAHSLHGITKESWRPSFAKCTDTLLSQCNTESFDDVAIFCSIHLQRANKALSFTDEQTMCLCPTCASLLCVKSSFHQKPNLVCLKNKTDVCRLVPPLPPPPIQSPKLCT